MNITDQQWQLAQSVLGSDPVRSDRRGRPWSNQRAVFNGILWVMWAEAPWRAMPPIFPPFTTVHRRMCKWHREGKLQAALSTLGEDLLRKLQSGQMEDPTSPSEFGAGRAGSSNRDFPMPANSTGDLAKALLSPLASSLMRNHQLQAELENMLCVRA